MPKKCKIESCQNNVFSGGYCKYHQQHNEKQKKRTDINSTGQHSGVRTNTAYARKLWKSPGKSVQKSKSPARKKKKPLQYHRKPTGDAAFFKETLEKALQRNSEGITCPCCTAWIGANPSISCFSHVLPKGPYPAFRHRPGNVWIVCEQCHWDWDFGDRSQPKFEEKRRVAEDLRLAYNTLQNRTY